MNAQQSPFRQAVVVLGNQLKKTLSGYDLMQEYVNVDRIPEANEVAFALEAECEKLVLLTRALPYYTGYPQASLRMEQTILQSVPVEMRFSSEGWFIMKIPALLPKKERGSAEYIRGILYPAMQRFSDSRPRFHFSECVIVFHHIYNRIRPERQYRDHDNIELNAVVDLIALYLLDGDMPLRCFHFYCSAAGESDCTEVTVLPKADFTRWLIGENILETEAIRGNEKPP